MRSKLIQSYPSNSKQYVKEGNTISSLKSNTKSSLKTIASKPNGF